MAQDAPWQLENYRAILRFHLRQLQCDPRLQGRFDDSDVIQETLLRAHGSLKSFQGRTEAELLNWLAGILGNTLTDEVRKARAGKRNVYLEKSLQGLLAESSNRWEAYIADKKSLPSARMEREETMARIAAALEQLPPDQRDAVTLRDIMGVPFREIAKQLGRTERSVVGLVMRGREKLRQLLDE